MHVSPVIRAEDIHLNLLFFIDIILIILHILTKSDRLTDSSMGHTIIV